MTDNDSKENTETAEFFSSSNGMIKTIMSPMPGLALTTAFAWPGGRRKGKTQRRTAWAGSPALTGIADL